MNFRVRDESVKFFLYVHHVIGLKISACGNDSGGYSLNP